MAKLTEEEATPSLLAEQTGAVCAFVILSVIGISLAGCSTYTPPVMRYRPMPSSWRGGSNRPDSYHSLATRPSRIVRASWYGPGFDGHRTSSGEVYHSGELTAASRILPIGTKVRVKNLANGRSVVVRINDRGPYVRGRSLDLSRRAAGKIGLLHKGVGRVEITRVNGAVHSSYHYARRHHRRRYHRSHEPAVPDALAAAGRGERTF